MSNKITIESIEKQANKIFDECGDPYEMGDIPERVKSLYRQKIAELVREKTEELRISKGKAIRVAEFVGCSPTIKGPIAQARRDGYECALSEITAAFKEAGVEI